LTLKLKALLKQVPGEDIAVDFGLFGEPVEGGEANAKV